MVLVNQNLKLHLVFLGSHLGLLLFLSFGDCLNIYPDDESQEDFIYLQTQVNQINNWQPKPFKMRCSITFVGRRNCVEDLGIFFNSNNTFVIQIIT